MLVNCIYPPTAQGHSISGTGRPVRGILHELNGKIEPRNVSGDKAMVLSDRTFNAASAYSLSNFVELRTDEGSGRANSGAKVSCDEMLLYRSSFSEEMWTIPSTIYSDTLVGFYSVPPHTSQ